MRTATSKQCLRDMKTIVITKGKRGDFCPPQPDHFHNYYEIFYLLSGQCHYLLNDSVYRLAKGDFVFIPPGELHHSLYKKGESCDICLITFTKEHLLLNSGLTQQAFMGSVPALYQEAFDGLLSRMLSEHAHIDDYSDPFMSVYLQEVLLTLMRHSVLAEQEPDLLNARDADILLATKYIYRNFRQQLSLDEVSAVAALSPTYFSKKFKQTTGMGFKEYLNYVRLKYARTALLTTDSSITDIALEYGFNDSNYFKDLFKKVYGKSPREFRRNPD